MLDLLYKTDSRYLITTLTTLVIRLPTRGLTVTDTLQVPERIATSRFPLIRQTRDEARETLIVTTAPLGMDNPPIRTTWTPVVVCLGRRIKVLLPAAVPPVNVSPPNELSVRT